MALFNRIREATAQVADRARWVSLKAERIDAFADELVPRSAAESGAGGGSGGGAEQVTEQVTEQADPAHHLRDEEESSLAFVLTMDAVNFGSGWFPHLRKRPGASGYFTIAGGLKDHFDRAGPLAPSQLATIGADECARIFGQAPARAPVTELMELFAQSWRDLGALVNARFGGSFVGLVKAADNKAERLVEILGAMPLYRDVEWYGDLEVPFYKRAQITCADLASTFGESGLGRFDDLDAMTIFADNLVPHVLRKEGVLEYHGDLLERIQAGELIGLGSAEEIEIRALAVHAVERLSAILTARGQPAPPRRLDSILWHRGQSPAIKAEPRHRTRCTYY